MSSSAGAATAEGYAAFGFEQLQAPPRRRGASADPAAVAAEREAELAALREQAEQAVAAAREQGRAEGVEAGRAEAIARLTPALEALEAAGEQLRAERERSAEAIERQAIELALALAERVVAGAIEAEPERVVDVVRGVLRGLVERERVLVLVNPDDLATMSEAADALAAELGGIARLEVQAERRVATGGAVVRTERSEIDATARSKLDRAREALIAELRA